MCIKVYKLMLRFFKYVKLNMKMEKNMKKNMNCLSKEKCEIIIL